VRRGAAAFARLRRERGRRGAQEGLPAASGVRHDTREAGLGVALPAVFLISLSVLVFEIALTRVFSVMLTYHFVFAIVSVAMFGLGAGGLVFARLGRRHAPKSLWAGALTCAVTMVGAVLLILTLPIAQFAGFGTIRLVIYIALALVPFTAAGYTLSGIFRRFPRRSSLLYGADLSGAALGALAVVPAMDAWGGVNVIFLAATIGGGAALLLGLGNRWRILLGLAALALFAGVFAVSARSGNGIPVPIVPDASKEMAGLLAEPAYGARVVESRWSSFGRTDLVTSSADPGEMNIFVDGAAGSAMLDLPALKRDPKARMEQQMHSGEWFPLEVLRPKQKRSALILGPGGGRDVDLALLAGVKRITAVEVNPDVVALVRKYSAFNGGIYSGYPGVNVVIGDGREYARTSKQRYDLIMAAIPVTKSSRSVEGYALTENGLFTTESIKDYLDRLTPDGRLVFVAHNDVEVYKLIATALAAFKAQGLSESVAMRNIYTVGAEMMPAVVVQKRPVTGKEANLLHYGLHAGGFDKVALFIPGIPQQTRGTLRMLDQGLVDIASGATTMEAVIAQAPFDLRPPTDDRPFFYKYDRGLPETFKPFLVASAVAAAALAVLVLLPRSRRRAGTSFVAALRSDARLKAYLLVFSALGLGFMLVEIAVFQKLAPYISRPQTALSVLLFALLLGGGIGSGVTSLLSKTGRRVALIALPAAVAAAALALSAAFPRAFDLGLDPPLAAALVVLPLGILMGCPFPLALRALAADGLDRHTPVFWGVNGLAAVLGSAFAMMLGITWGFSAALVAGSLAYLAVAAGMVVLRAWRRVPVPGTELSDADSDKRSQLRHKPFMPSPSRSGTVISQAVSNHRRNP